MLDPRRCLRGRLLMPGGDDRTQQACVSPVLPVVPAGDHAVAPSHPKGDDPPNLLGSRIAVALCAHGPPPSSLQVKRHRASA